MSRFSETVIDHCQSPRQRGVLKRANAVGVSGSPGGGPYVVIHLKIAETSIQQAKFESHSCGATVASCSMLMELITGQSVAQAASITPDELIAELDGLPVDKLHCAHIAVAALNLALSDWEENGRPPPG